MVSKASEATEEGAKEILMTLIKQKINKPVSMSYRQVQQQKREVKNARGYRPVIGGSSGSGVTMRRDLQHLKSVTRCKSWGELGYWQKECPQKGSNPSKILSGSSGATSASATHGWWSLVQSADDPDPSEAAGSSSMVQSSHEYETCSMVMWTTDVMANNISRTMESCTFSPKMREAIGIARNLFPAGFASSSHREAQPLESRDSVVDAAVIDSPKQPIDAFHYCTQESYAVLDTGC